jgi:predicted nucleic acid-binding protein
VRAFVDSNVAVYAFESGHDPRCAVADALLARNGTDLELVLSTQVLLETYNVLVRKKKARPSRALAAAQFLSQYEVVAPTPAAALDALALAAEHGLPTYDAFIVQAALEAGCDTLFSEDLQAGRRFGKLVIVNPFDASAHEPLAEPAPAAPSVRSARSYRRKPARPA